MPSDTVVIKKYENRRLYDTTNSRYVNLDEIAQMVRNGVDIRVADAVSGEDLTRVVLTQIIVDDAKAQDSAFPLDLLRQMIIASGRASQESFVRYMQAMFDVYQNTYRAFTPGGTPFDVFKAALGGARPPAPQPAVPSPLETNAPVTDGETIKELRDRIDQLEQLMRKSAGEASGGKGTTKPGKRR